MSRALDADRCDQADLVRAYARQAVSWSDALAVEAHLPMCTHCRRELETLRPIIESFVFWPADVLRPAASFQRRLARRIAAEAGGEPAVVPAAREWAEPEWQEVAPGICCKVLATDMEKHRASMLVRLAPGAAYPSHTHAGVEELHVLDGELWIDDRKLYSADYSRAAPGTAHSRVWSENGCTCVLITSTMDRLR